MPGPPRQGQQVGEAPRLRARQLQRPLGACLRFCGGWPASRPPPAQQAHLAIGILEQGPLGRHQQLQRLPRGTQPRQRFGAGVARQAQAWGRLPGRGERHTLQRAPIPAVHPQQQGGPVGGAAALTGDPQLIPCQHQAFPIQGLAARAADGPLQQQTRCRPLAGQCPGAELRLRQIAEQPDAPLLGLVSDGGEPTDGLPARALPRQGLLPLQRPTQRRCTTLGCDPSRREQSRQRWHGTRRQSMR